MDFVRTVSSKSNEADATSSNSPSSSSSQRGSTDSSGLHGAIVMEEGVIAAPPAPSDGTLQAPTDRTSTAAASAETETEQPTEIQDDDDAEVDDQDEEEEEEEEDEYEYEEEDDAAFAGFLVDNPAIAASRSLEDDQKQQASSSNNNESPTKIEEEPSSHAASAAASQGEAAAAAAVPQKPKWREPSRAAVDMSLRAEKETTASKRRLAKDLYRIMNKDTEETGFSLEPSSEDCMNKWTIKLFQFDKDSNLAKDLAVLGMDAVHLEMTFPDDYPFEPPFVRVVRPRFKRQTGFVMNGALCMELLTKDGWNPINDIESVIVSIRSLLVVGEGRLETAYNLPESKYKSLLEAAEAKAKMEAAQGDCKMSASAGVPAAGVAAAGAADHDPAHKRLRKNSAGDAIDKKKQPPSDPKKKSASASSAADSGSYSVSEAQQAYEHLSSYHKKKGWDQSGWWAKKG